MLGRVSMFSSTPWFAPAMSLASSHDHPEAKAMANVAW
jgi:hypothetical protein